MVGCGNSSKILSHNNITIGLSQEMYKDGYHHITNMDISQVVVDKMQKIYHPDKCPLFECNP